MVYLHKKYDNKRRVEYEYGGNEKEYIGTIAFDIGVSVEKDFSERNPELTFYDNYTFCKLTVSALQGIASFIREDSYPESYLRATH